MQKSALIVASVLFLSACAAVGGGGAPSEVVRSYFEAAFAFDIDRAKSYLTSDLQAQVKMTPEAQAQIDQLKALMQIKIKDFKVLEEKISSDGNTATVKFEITIEMSALGKTQSQTQSGDAELKKENGQWKISKQIGGMSTTGGLGGGVGSSSGGFGQ
ncbi:DUF4878 domain-containing protein [Candidatus Micrarchaeota archaeon]|nr:DUF4878 domain-containing protein [Candidatus Micrarchaeota archaeon]